MLSSRISRKLSPTKNSADDRDAAQDVRDDEDEPSVDAVDEDACDRREQHGRHEERQDQGADRGVRARRFETMTVRPKRTMLPPIWVAACESQRRRNAPLRKTSRALSDPGGRPGVAPAMAGRRRRCLGHGSRDRTAIPRRRSSPRRLGTRTRRAAVRGAGVRAGRVVHRSGSAGRYRRPADRRATVAAARMGPPEPHDIAEQQGQDGSSRHGGQGIRAAAGRWPGRGRARSPGRSCPRPGSPPR